MVCTMEKADDEDEDEDEDRDPFNSDSGSDMAPESQC